MQVSTLSDAQRPDPVNPDPDVNRPVRFGSVSRCALPLARSTVPRCRQTRDMGASAPAAPPLWLDADESICSPPAPPLHIFRKKGTYRFHAWYFDVNILICKVDKTSWTNGVWSLAKDIFQIKYDVGQSHLANEARCSGFP